MRLTATRRWLRVVAALLVPWLLVSCSVGGLFRRPTPEPVTIRLGLLPFVSNTVVQIGIDEGYSAEQGLIIEKTTFKALSEVFPALASGQIDVATPGSIPALFNLMASGARVKMVMSLTQHVEAPCSSAALLARKEDVESGKYKAIASWVDARFMSVIGLSGTEAYFLSEALATVGLTIDDLQMAQGPREVHAEALRAGQVDIIFEIEPWVTRAQSQGDIRVLAALEPYAPGLQGSTIVYGAKLLDDQDAGTRFAVAYLKAARQYAQGATPRNVEIAAAFSGQDAEFIKKLCWSYVPTDGSLNVPSLMAYQQWMYERGDIDRVMDEDEFIDTSFAEEAVRILDDRE